MRQQIEEISTLNFEEIKLRIRINDTAKRYTQIVVDVMRAANLSKLYIGEIYYDLIFNSWYFNKAGCESKLPLEIDIVEQCNQHLVDKVNAVKAEKTLTIGNYRRNLDQVKDILNKLEQL